MSFAWIFARIDMRVARRRAFLGMAWRQSLGRFCFAWPPPFLMGLRMPPVRALPVPFWRNIFRVEPATSPRACVCTVPCRWLAWYITIACFSRSLFSSAPPSLASSSLKVDTFWPDWLKTGTSIIGSLRCRFHSCRDALANENERAVRTRQRSFDQQEVLLFIDPHQRMVARGDAIGSHVAGHAHALL